MTFSPLMTIFPQGVEAVELTNEILLSDNNEEQTLKQFDSLSSNYFIQNDGQMIGSESLFYSTSGDIHFLPDAVLMRFRELEPVFEDEKEKRELMDPFEEDTPDSFYEKGVVLKYSFVDANKMVPYGRGKCSWNTNYFKGSDPDHWYTDIPNYNEIVFPEVWDGIDIVYRLKDGNVKYDIVLSPEADPGLIQFRIEGNTDIVIDESGDLVIGTEYRDILDSGLIAFYGDSENVGIDIDFKLINRDHFGFELGSYDRSRGVVIDPLIYSTFIGGNSGDYGYNIDVDSSGNAYVTGQTYVSTTDYPTTTGAYDKTFNGGSDVFVTKLNSAGSSLVYSTFLGGSKTDEGRSIAFDSSGNAYLTGFTSDSTTDYPTTTGAYDRIHNGYTDVFVTKLNATGSSLIYSTFIGGSSSDSGYGIAIDSSGNAYVTGRTIDTDNDFPTTSGTYDSTFNGGYDVFITKVN
ncbi:MAG: SBBP repeat-containing protein, partial [Thermoplasmata archaeon]|nr:SBBP repeat-containing protein [Thermoplasmata archaeon]